MKTLWNPPPGIKSNTVSSSCEGREPDRSRQNIIGVTDEPKNRKHRDANLSPSVLRGIRLWRSFALPSDYIFASEAKTTPIKYENLWQREIKPKFEEIGPGWADFRCMRRTNSTLMKEAGADVKVSADQRGHNVNASINEYTQSTSAQKAAAVNLLDEFLESQVQ